MVEQVASEIFIPLTVGGGIREVKDITRLLNAGADKVAINTSAVTNPDFIGEASSLLGSQCIVVALDARKSGNTTSGYEIYTHGGRRETGLDAVEWAQKMTELGAGELLVTSMDRDGTKDGFELELTSAIANAVSIPVIASGGVGSLQHLVEGITIGKADAVLAASIFHFAQYSIGQAKRYMKDQGIMMRV